MDVEEAQNSDESVVALDKILDILNYDDSLNYLYDETSKEKVEEALTSMGFQILISTFEVEKIDYTVFTNMDDQFIYGVLKRFPWGIRKKFAMEYEIWLKRMKSNESGHTIFRNQNIGHNYLKVNEETISVIINEDPEAKQFFEEHSNDESPLPLGEKRRLVGIIINYFVDKKITLSKKDIEILSKGIETYFTGESSQEYCNNKSGLLYNKSKNMINKYRKIGALDAAPCKKKFKVDNSNEEKEKFNGTEIDADSFIKTNAMEPLKDILPLWEISFKIRRHAIMSICANSGIKGICELYKSFTRNDGWILINSDFEKLFPSSDFSHKWNSFKNNLLDILLTNVANVAIKENLKQCKETGDNSQSIAVIKGLHAFLYSAGMRTDPNSSKGKKIKDTIQDSIKTMFIQCPNEASLNTEMAKIRNFYENKGNTFQPVIVGFECNDINAKSYFLVYFDDNYYRLESFDKALEVLLKLYYVMDLKFPVSSQAVFAFLSAYFLEVQVEISSKVKSLINLLNSKLL